MFLLPVVGWGPNFMVLHGNRKVGSVSEPERGEKEKKREVGENRDHTHITFMMILLQFFYFIVDYC